MTRIDFSKALSFLDNDMILEAEAARSMKAAKKPQLSRYIAIAASCAAVILAVVFIGRNGRAGIPGHLPNYSEPIISQAITGSDSQPATPPSTEEPPVSSVSDTPVSDTPVGDTPVGDTPTEPDTTPNEAPTEPDTTGEPQPIGGGDYTFVRKYVEEAENIYIAAQIVGQETRDEWINNVYLNLSPEEQSELPELYRIIHDLNISKEDFIAENNKLSDYPGMYYSEDIIEALYLDDIKEMKKRLVNPTALYYDGEIYTFDGLLTTPELADNIPSDILSEYLDFIYDTAVQIGQIKYMQEDINRVRSRIKP